MEASSDAQNFFDNVGLDLQKQLEKACGINEQVSARVLRTTECTTLLANTAGGSICDIPVESGAGQGRALATPKSLAALSIRERFTNMNAAGERFPGRCNTFAQLSNQAYADDESSSNLGPLAPQLTALTQEASTLAADLGLRCPNNPDKSTMSYTVWDAEGAQQHTDGNEIVLFTGPQRTPAYMEATKQGSKLVGITLHNGINHTTTDKARALTTKAFVKKVGESGGLLLTELAMACRVVQGGVNGYRGRTTISARSTSAAIDKLVRCDRVAAGFLHHSTKTSVCHLRSRWLTVSASCTTRRQRAPALPTNSYGRSTYQAACRGETPSNRRWPTSFG